MKMYRFNLLMLVFVASAVLFTACPSPEEPYEFSVTPEELSFAAGDTAKQYVDVTTNVNSWRATASESWITILEEADRFAVTVEKNSAADARSGVITVKAGDAAPVTVTVTQEAGKPDDPDDPDNPDHNMDATPAQMNFSNTAESKTLQITANVAWPIDVVCRIAGIG